MGLLWTMQRIDELWPLRYWMLANGRPQLPCTSLMWLLSGRLPRHDVLTQKHPCPSCALHMSQGRLCLRQPERHLHGSVELDGLRQFGAGVVAQLELQFDRP